MAEVLMIRRAERSDQLYLLANIAAGLGSKGLEKYDPPAAVFAQLTEEEEAAMPDSPEDRYEQVMSFVAATGGEAAGG